MSSNSIPGVPSLNRYHLLENKIEGKRPKKKWFRHTWGQAGKSCVHSTVQRKRCEIRKRTGASGKLHGGGGAN
jgi:hypothetical protein